MTFTLFGNQNCCAVKRALYVANAAGVPVHVSQANSTSGKTPALSTPQGTISGAQAIARFIAASVPTKNLMGRSFFETAKVEEYCEQISCCSKEQTNQLELLKQADQQLLESSYLVGERLSLADISLAVMIDSCLSNSSVKAADIASMTSLTRWFNTIAQVVGMERRLELQAMPETGKAKAAAKPAAKSPQASPKKAEKPADDDEEEAPKAPKKKNPLDELPAPSMAIDAWKREYSNNKDKKAALEWFWQNASSNDYSLWYMDYEKYTGEGEKLFLTSNLVAGYLQRLDQNFRKYSFGVSAVVGEEMNYDVKGVWMWRGQEIPFEISDHVSAEYFHYTKLDWTAEKTKKLVEEYWAGDEDEKDTAEGRPLAMTRCWK